MKESCLFLVRVGSYRLFSGRRVCYTSGKEEVSQYIMRSTGKSGRSEASHVRFLQRKTGIRNQASRLKPVLFFFCGRTASTALEHGEASAQFLLPKGEYHGSICGSSYKHTVRPVLCGLGYYSFILPSNTTLWWGFRRGALPSPGFRVSSLVPSPCARGEDELRSGRMSFFSSYSAPLPGRKGAGQRTQDIPHC